MAPVSRQTLLGLLLLASCAEAFQPGVTSPVTASRNSYGNVKVNVNVNGRALFMNSDDNANTNANDGPEQQQPRRGLRKRMGQARNAVTSKIRPFGLGLVTAASICFSAAVLTSTPPAHAATPLPKQATMPDAEKTAMRSIKMEMEKKREQERLDYTERARAIEAREGVKARETFEREYAQAKQQKEQEMMDDLEELQRSLLDKGVDPFNDMEGYRQCFLIKTGKNLAEVEGTDQYADAQMEKMGMTKQMYAFQKSTNRQLIKMMVQDYKNRGIDPLPIFANKDNHQKHANILFLPKAPATRKLASFQENMGKFGQLEPPKEGELSLKEKQDNDPDFAQKQEDKLNAAAMKDEASAKESAKVKATEAKAALKAGKIKAKEEAKAMKLKAKEEAKIAKEAAKEAKRIAKEELKNEKNAAKVAAAAATTAAAGAAVASKAAGDVAGAGINAAKSAATAGTEIVAPDTSTGSTGKAVSMEDFEDDSKFQGEPVVVESTSQKTSPLVKFGGFVAVAVGGKFVIDRRNQPSAAEEEERQKQFKLLMGLDDSKSSSGPDTSGAIDTTATDSVDADIEASTGDDDDDAVVEEKPEDKVAPAPPAPKAEVAPPAPKKRRGIKSMFSKKSKNDRETDLNALISTGAKAPAVATLLSKLLTFGAPGRFPVVNSLGDMPMEEFDLEKAKEMLEASVEEAGITKEEGAEVFANVVNCMLIDIIDLASSSLREKGDITYEAINIVIEFMNHAASLYDAVAEGVVITPVTYGGNLPKSKLEEMYGTYSFAGMMKMEEDMNDRIELLRNVFDITEKKAEGIIMKASQKNMMEMMKTEDGQKQMEDMMGGMMGGAEGMEGLAGMAGMMGDGAEGEEPNPEQLKEMLSMLKMMKDSGSIPPEELVTVREQFRESFGSSIDEILSQADAAGGEMSDADKELLDLMKSILED